MTQIVATGPVPALAYELLGAIVVADGPEELERLLADAEVLIVRGGSTVTEETLAAAPRLRVIARSGVGFSEVDVAAATRRGIPVVIAPSGGARAVAEGALTLMLALGKRLTALDAAVRTGDWAFRDAVELRDLWGATLGIVGFGRIGRTLAELVAPFEMRLLVHDPYASGVDSVELTRLFAESDFISLHAPLTDGTRGLVNARLLARAERAPILVNLARGGLIRSLDDLVVALDTGLLGGVGLDVFEPEPPQPEHPLFAHERALCTPHALWRTPRALEGIFREMCEGTLAALRGERPSAVADPSLYS